MHVDESHTEMESSSSFMRFIKSNWPVSGPLLVLLVAAAATVVHGWYPVSDLALIELKTSDIPGRFPLLGAYSRMGWAHPGPAHFVWMAIPYRLFGSVGMPLAMLTLHGVGAALIWWLAKQRDRLFAALLMLGLVGLFVVRPLVELRSTWNPHVSVVVTVLLMVAVWRLIDGDSRAIVVILPVSSLLVQSHLGNANVVLGAAVGFGVVALWLGVSRLRSTVVHVKEMLLGHRWWWVTAFVVTGLLWLPAIIDQFSNDPGNISAILTESGDEESVAVTFEYAVQFYLQSFAAMPTWVGTPSLEIDGGLALGWVIPIWLLLPVAATTLAGVSKNWSQLRIMVSAVVAHLVACFAIVTYSGDVYPYLVVWLAPISLSVLVASVWVICSYVVDRTPNSERVVMTVIGAGVMILSLWAAILQTGDHQLFHEVQPAARTFATEIVERSNGQPVFIDALWDFDALAALPPLVLAAENNGIDAITSDWQASGFGEHRVGEPGDRMRFHVGPSAWTEQAIAEGWKPIRTVAVVGATDGHGNPQERDSLTLFIRE